MARTAALPKYFSAALLLLALPGVAARSQEPASPPRVVYIILEGQIIHPVTARFVARALRHAEATHAECLVIQLDTPGGLLDSTRRIVKDILQADVPVVVYVAPSGARAGSAGVFITLAAHVAVMAPGTNIGAAHPVSLGGGPGPLPGPAEDKQEDRMKPSTDPLSEKITNDTIAWARALAQYRGRNVDWAARAVKESISTPVEEARKEKVIDFIAKDREDLLAQLDGREISLPVRTVVLHTRRAEVEQWQMGWPERLLDILAHPTIAYLLLLLGFYGLLFEITHPGVWVPGILGLICLALAFFALQMLPINYAGLGLILLGLVLLIAEVKLHSLGLLTFTGLACLLIGSFMLIEPVPGVERVSWLVVAPATAATALIMLLLVGNVVRAHRAPVLTGVEGLVGSVGVARTDIEGRGFVFVRGELWQARSDRPLRAGQAVRVQGCQGLTLQVERVDGVRS